MSVSMSASVSDRICLFQLPKSLGWENVVSPSNQVTVIVSTANKHVHISFYGTTIGFARTCVSAQNYLCAEIVLFVRILSIDHTLI